MAKTLTTYYLLGKWEDGDNPGATDLNSNWTTIDTALNANDEFLQTVELEREMELAAVSSRVNLHPVAVKTADYAVQVGDTTKHFNNSGAGAQVNFTLPALTSSLVGLTYTFVVLTAQNVRLSPGNATDLIRNAASVSTASTGHIDNATVGGVVTVVAITSGLWICTSTVGTWTVT